MREIGVGKEKTKKERTTKTTTPSRRTREIEEENTMQKVERRRE
jgi:hypothetical protein